MATSGVGEVADIPGNATTTASISVGGSVTGTLETFGDHDWFRIQLTAGQSITITLNGTTLQDPFLRILNSSGGILQENDDISSGVIRDSRISFTAPTTGTYYIDAGAWQDNYVGDYQLNVTTYVAPSVWTYDQIGDQLIRGYWGGTSHRFNVSPGGQITVNLTALTPEGQSLARGALATWTDVIGVRFVEVATGGQIVFDDNEAGAHADSMYSGSFITSSTVNVSTQWLVDYGTRVGGYAYQTYIHEIGHALGLGHAGNYNGNANYQSDALYANDSWATTVMSYFSQTENSYFSGLGFDRNYLVTPMVADMVAMSMLYGLSTTTRTGDTVYGFNSNAGGVYVASGALTFAYTIIDSGGTDTLDYSGYTVAQRIDLNPEAFSNIGGDRGNVAIARGTIIENAIGGSGADVIIGNSAANVLTGGAGIDTLTGGAGNDTFRGTKSGFNGDTITDFSSGDRIVIIDAALTSFSFSLSGTTLTYTGGSLRLSAPIAGTLVASGAAEGGVQLAISIATTPANDVRNDFNGDGRSDLLLRNDNGTITEWLGQTNGGFFSNHALSTYGLATSWHVDAVGDFNGDGRDDVLLRNDNGSMTNWLGQSNGSFFSNHVNASYVLPAGWHIEGAGDFNGDGRDDLLLRNDNGAVTEWLGQANGGFFSNHAVAAYGLSTSWHVDAIGDFNGDGYDDLLLRNDNGSVTNWLGQAGGSFVSNHVNANYALPAGWQVEGAGDFNGDGRDDLLLRNSNGTITEWLGQQDGSFFSNHAAVAYPLATSWHVDAIGDFNGDGRDDLLLRNDNGSITDWLGAPNGSFFSNHANASYAMPQGWHIQADNLWM